MLLRCHSEQAVFRGYTGTTLRGKRNAETLAFVAGDKRSVESRAMGKRVVLQMRKLISPLPNYVANIFYVVKDIIVILYFIHNIIFNIVCTSTNICI